MSLLSEDMVISRMSQAESLTSLVAHSSLPFILVVGAKKTVSPTSLMNPVSPKYVFRTSEKFSRTVITLLFAHRTIEVFK